MRGFRAFFAAVGAFYDALLPPRYVESPTVKSDAVKCSYCPVNDGVDCTLNCECERRAYFRQQLVECEATEEVAEACIPCVVDECPDVFDSVAALNTHSYQNHQQPHPLKVSADPRVTYHRYPGATAAGDFKWFNISTTAPAASVIADRPAEVSADPTPAPSAGRPVPALSAGSPNSVASVHVEELVAVAAEYIDAHGRHEHFNVDGERLWRCSRLCGLENLTAAEHARHVAELVVPAIVFELTDPARARPLSAECGAADRRVDSRLADAGFKSRLDASASAAGEFFPQHTQRPTQ